MFLFAVVSVLFLGSPTRAAQSQVTLKFRPPVGKTYKYRMAMVMKMEQGRGTPSMDTQTDVDVDTKVLSRSGDFTTLETRMSNPRVTIPINSPMAAMKKQMEDSMAGKVSRSKVDSLCHTQSGTGTNAMMDSFNSMLYSKRSLKVGDTWSSSVDFNKLLGSMGSGLPGAKAGGNIPVKFRLQKIAYRGSQTVADIHVTMKGRVTMGISGQQIAMNIDGSGDYVLDVASGMTISSKIASTNNMTFADKHVIQRTTQTMGLR